MPAVIELASMTSSLVSSIVLVVLSSGILAFEKIGSMPKMFPGIELLAEGENGYKDAL